jgi:hypothetical protein
MREGRLVRLGYCMIHREEHGMGHGHASVGFLTKVLKVEFFQAVKKLKMIY